MKRPPVALWVWYRGGAFRGFQRQADGPTVQAAVEAALAEAGVPSTVMPAGRTDRGVHARMQVLSVRQPPGDTPDALAERLAARLAASPDAGWGLCAARRPAPAFHAQWSARGKEYRYRLQLEGAPAPAWAPYAFDVAQEPRLAGARVTPERLAGLLAACEGARDFGAFHESSSPRKLRTLHAARLHARGDGLYEVRLVGDAFARYQVRYLVGTCVLVAAGVLPEAALAAALERAAPLPGLKAPAHGLVLWEVHYAPELEPFGPALRDAPPGLPPAPPFS